MELWKPVSGYENYYEVSNLGRVRSIDRVVTRSDGVEQLRRGKIKAQTVSYDGYMTVHLSLGGSDKRLPVHRLVADAFVSGRFDGAEVNHKDFDRTNNSADNLEWVSHKDNVAHTISAGRHVCNRDLSGSNNPNYGNHKLRSVYASDKSLSKEKQSRAGSSNGRAVGVLMCGGAADVSFGTIKECAKYMVDTIGITNVKIETVAFKISQCVKSGGQYLGFTFKKK